MDLVFDQQALFSLLLGVLAGFVCFAGLAYGMKILLPLLTDKEKKLDKKQRKKIMALGLSVLVGQFFVDLFILFFAVYNNFPPLYLGFGIVIGLAISLTAGRFFL